LRERLSVFALGDGDVRNPHVGAETVPFDAVYDPAQFFDTDVVYGQVHVASPFLRTKGYDITIQSPFVLGVLYPEWQFCKPQHQNSVFITLNSICSAFMMILSLLA